MPFEGTGERVYQGLVLVNLRSRRWHSRACRVSASVAPQQGYLIARNSSIPRKRRPAYKNSGAGMILDEWTDLALKKAVAPGPD